MRVRFADVVPGQFFLARGHQNNIPIRWVKVIPFEFNGIDYVCNAVAAQADEPCNCDRFHVNDFVEVGAMTPNQQVTIS